MVDPAVVETLQRFVATDLLDDPACIDDLTSDAPLLEWGVLDSLNLARLLSFLAGTFEVHVPVECIVAEHFRDLRSIASLVERLREQPENAVGERGGVAAR